MDLFESTKAGQLIGKYLTGKESKEEQIQLKAWLDKSSENQMLFNSLKEEKNIAESISEFETYNKDIAWKKYKEHIEILSFRKILTWWKFAAVFFFLVGCSGIIAYLNKGSVLPIKPTETYTTVSTQNGQNSKVILPDSSVVWINSGTTLSYNSNFAVHERIIKLTGQAYFQVSRNEQMPLIVYCNELNVSVLGTRFDVSSYPEDENVRVVLESGSVKLSQANSNQSPMQVMNPGEKAEFNVALKKLAIEKVNSHDYTSWKEGILIFKNEPMKNVIEKLKRWYNIDIEVENSKVNNLFFNATIVNENIEEIFDLIRFSCAISYTIIPSRNPNIPVKVIITK